MAHQVRRRPSGGEGSWNADGIVEALCSAPVGLAIVDLRLRYVWVNDLFASLNGVPAADHAGRTPTQVIPDIAPQVESLMRTVIATVTTVTRKIHGARPSTHGERRDWLVSYFPIPATDGSVGAVGVVIADATERNRAVAALDDNEVRTRRILDAALDAVIAMDAAGDVIEWSARAETMFGWSREEVVGMSLDRLIIPERFRAAHREGLARYRDSGVGEMLGKRIEIAALRRDGTEFPVELTVIALPGDDPPTFSAFVRDVSERRVAETAIRKSEDRADDAVRLGEQRLRSVIETAPSGIVVVDGGGVITLVNHAAEAMFGYPREELVGSRIERLVPEGARALHERVRSDYLKTPETRVMGVDRHLFALRSDGSQFPVEVGLAVAHTDEGPLVTAIVTDVSERVRSQEDLQKSLGRLASLSAIDRAILSSRSTNEVMHAALVGLRRVVPCERASVAKVDVEAKVAVMLALESSLSRDVADGTVIAIHDDLADLRQGRMRILTDPDPRSVESGIAAIAEEGIHSLVVLPMLVEGALVGMLTLGAVRHDAFGADQLDIATEVADQLAIALHQSQMQEQLERHAEELEGRVAERTEELEEMNAQLDAFAYSVSHDLRAPLRAMEGFSQALLEDYGEVLGEEGRDYAGRVVRAAGRMDQLIKDLLSYSRLTRGDLAVGPLEMGPVVADALAQVVADPASRDPDALTEGSFPTVMGHRPTMQQIVVNLLTNAVKFVDDDVRPRVRVWCEERGDMARLCVGDNGIGIAPEFHAQVFGVLERLHGVERYPGTGIGLAIVAKGAARMGGRAGVDSVPGEGSIFWVELQVVHRGAQ
jgi:PAS domain S-box-containing protein